VIDASWLNHGKSPPLREGDQDDIPPGSTD